MGTILASAIVNQAATILQDTTNVRWPAPELLGWLNAGQQDIVLYKPNASVKNAARQLSPGTRQALPTDGIALLDVTRNLGTTGNTPGRAIRIVAREVLDAQLPDWHTATATAEVKHYVYSAADPKHYYVYPPQPSSSCGWVEEIYSCAPPNVTINQPIALDDIYANILLDYILYRAYSKDAEYSANEKNAATHFTAYVNALRGKTGAEQLADPNDKGAANTPQR